MFANLNGWHLIILLVVILLLFGAAKLPALAKSVGQSARILKGEIRESRAESRTAEADTSTVTVDADPRTNAHASRSTTGSPDTV